MEPLQEKETFEGRKFLLLPFLSVRPKQLPRKFVTIALAGKTVFSATFSSESKTSAADCRNRCNNHLWEC